MTPLAHIVLLRAHEQMQTMRGPWAYVRESPLSQIANGKPDPKPWRRQWCLQCGPPVQTGRRSKSYCDRCAHMIEYGTSLELSE